MVALGGDSARRRSTPHRPGVHVTDARSVGSVYVPRTRWLHTAGRAGEERGASGEPTEDGECSA